MAHVGLKLGFALGQQSVFLLDKAAHLCPNGIHKRPAVAVADHLGGDTSSLLVATHLDDLCQLCHLGVDQRQSLVQVLAGRIQFDLLAQGGQSDRNVIAHCQIGLQKHFVTRDQIAPLTGLGIFQVRQNIPRAVDDPTDVPPILRTGGDLVKRPECERHAQPGQQHGDHHARHDFGCEFHP